MVLSESEVCTAVAVRSVRSELLRLKWLAAAVRLELRMLRPLRALKYTWGRYKSPALQPGFWVASNLNLSSAFEITNIIPDVGAAASEINGHVPVACSWYWDASRQHPVESAMAMMRPTVAKPVEAGVVHNAHIALV
jgi:hypothetical protein